MSLASLSKKIRFGEHAQANQKDSGSRTKLGRAACVRRAKGAQEPLVTSVVVHRAQRSRHVGTDSVGMGLRSRMGSLSEHSESRLDVLGLTSKWIFEEQFAGMDLGKAESGEPRPQTC
jgi:hypothetical protein